MSNQVAVYDDQLKYTQDKINLIKNTVAKGATDDELQMFTSIAQKYGLDPFIKEIWFIKRAKKAKTGRKDSSGKDIWDYKKLPNGEIDYTGADTLIMTSRDGYLKIAQRDPAYDGILSFAICEGDTFEIDAENYKVTHKFGLKRGPIIGAWCKVDHKNRKPVITYVPLNEYYDEKSTTWKQYKTAMIIKVAEVLALKRQFGISGLVTREEMTAVHEEEFETAIEIKPETIIHVDDKPEQQEEEERFITGDEASAIYATASFKGVDKKKIYAWAEKNLGKKIKSLTELTEKEATKLNADLRKMPDVKKDEPQPIAS